MNSPFDLPDLNILCREFKEIGFDITTIQFHNAYKCSIRGYIVGKTIDELPRFTDSGHVKYKYKLHDKSFTFWRFFITGATCEVIKLFLPESTQNLKKEINGCK